ncbi:MAG: Holliday junction branch migration protein RuvA [Mariprofundaceae bacterium]
MIGWLGGIIRDINPTGSVLLDVNGVGYDVSLSMQTLCRLKQGERAELCIHTHVREDQITLFGFTDVRERALFRQLNQVSGVGARTALNILSALSIDELLTAIDSSDDVAIARTPGIGKKTAMRLILELRGKLVEQHDESDTNAAANQELRSALTNLGYSAPLVNKVLKKIEPADFETMFKAALKAI